jgi:hypothetical protein
LKASSARPPGVAILEQARNIFSVVDFWMHRHQLSASAQTTGPDIIYMCAVRSKCGAKLSASQWNLKSATRLNSQGGATTRPHAKKSHYCSDTATECEAFGRVHLETFANTWGGYLKCSKRAVRLGLSGSARRRLARLTVRRWSPAAERPPGCSSPPACAC